MQYYELKQAEIEGLKILLNEACIKSVKPFPLIDRRLQATGALYKTTLMQKLKT